MDCKLYLHPENGETQLNLSASSGARNSKSDIGCQALCLSSRKCWSFDYAEQRKEIIIENVMGLETVVGKRQSEGCVGWKKIRASLEIENSRDWLAARGKSRSNNFFSTNLSMFT